MQDNFTLQNQAQIHKTTNNSTNLHFFAQKVWWCENKSILLHKNSEIVQMHNKTMMVFKQVTTNDIDLIGTFFVGEKRERTIRALERYCNDNYHEMTMAVVNDILVLRQEISNMYVYAMPTEKPGTSGNMRTVLVQLMEDAEIMGYEWLIVGIREHEKALLRSALPHHFKYAGEEKYCYLDIVKFSKQVTDEPSLVAVPVISYTDSIFANNEVMVPTIGEFEQIS